MPRPRKRKFLYEARSFASAAISGSFSRASSISRGSSSSPWMCLRQSSARPVPRRRPRSEEHTSELQSRSDLVCRLLLEKKKKHKKTYLTLENKKKKNK